MATYSQQVMEGVAEHWTGLYNVFTFDVDVNWSTSNDGCEVLGKPRVNVDFSALPLWRHTVSVEYEDVPGPSERCDGGMKCKMIHVKLRFMLVRYVELQRFEENFSVRVCPDGSRQVID